MTIDDLPSLRVITFSAMRIVRLRESRMMFWVPCPPIVATCNVCWRQHSLSALHRDDGDCPNCENDGFSRPQCAFKIWRVVLGTISPAILLTGNDPGLSLVSSVLRTDRSKKVEGWVDGRHRGLIRDTGLSTSTGRLVVDGTTKRHQDDLHRQVVQLLRGAMFCDEAGALVTVHDGRETLINALIRPFK